MDDPHKLGAADTAAAILPEDLSSASDVQASVGRVRAGPHALLAGRYEILSLIGTGGMGAVYRAKDKELDEIVALKMLRDELTSDPTILARFRQEVKLARRVTHRNVARTFDIGEHGGAKFLTMEFVEGESLAAKLQRAGSMPLPEIAGLLEEICAGLAAAHAAGVVHRDLKPDNILLATDGRVVITDFGIARTAGDLDRSNVRTQGVPIGTPAYMAPEQVEGAADIDARADLYALGAILYELMTGERAWDGDSVFAVAAKRLVLPPPDPRARRPDLPDAAARLVVRCMARQPKDRFGTAAEVARALAEMTLPAVVAPVQASPATRLAPASAPVGKTVAVLPFRNRGADDDAYLADGLTDDLVDSLSMTTGLRVRPRASTAAAAITHHDPRELGAALGVQAVVDGSVRRVGDRFRIQARVIAVADGFQLWAKHFDCAANDVLTVGDSMTRAVAEALTCPPQAPARAALTDPVAIDLYLRARHVAQKGWGLAGKEALGLFEQALERAPDDAMILSGYAVLLAQGSGFAQQNAKELGLKAREAAERALALAPHLAHPHLAIATHLLNSGDAAGAARRARHALEMMPNVAEAHSFCGRLLSEAGAIPEGIARMRTALAYDPALVLAKTYLARDYAFRGLTDEVDSMLGGDPATLVAEGLWINRLRFGIWNREREKGIRWFAALKTGSFKMPTMAMVMAGLLAGEPVTEAIRADLQAMSGDASRSFPGRALFAQVRAELCALAGNHAEAILAVSEAADHGLFDIAWLDRCPLLVPLREDPALREPRARVMARAKEVLASFDLPTLA